MNQNTFRFPSFLTALQELGSRARHTLRDVATPPRFAAIRSQESLPVLIFRQDLLLRRRSDTLDSTQQELHAAALAAAAAQISGIIISPGETFSFWQAMGRPASRHRLPQDAVRACGPESIAQLIHWLAVHGPLVPVEQHCPEPLEDRCPNPGRQIPFGLAVQLQYPHRDYRFLNASDVAFQLVLRTDAHYLRGELRAAQLLPVRFRVYTRNEQFIRENACVYREGELLRDCLDSGSGAVLYSTVLSHYRARICYDPVNLPVKLRRNTEEPSSGTAPASPGGSGV